MTSKPIDHAAMLKAAPPKDKHVVQAQSINQQRYAALAAAQQQQIDDNRSLSKHDSNGPKKGGRGPTYEEKVLASKILKICAARWSPAEARTDQDVAYDMYSNLEPKLRRSKQPRVLIVMKDRFVAAGIAVMLKNFGCVVTTCSDGAKAYSKYLKKEAEGFSMCICDWERFGGIGGRDLCFYEREEGGTLPFVTIAPLYKSFQDYLRQGADLVLRAPLAVHILQLKELLLPNTNQFIFPSQLLGTPSNHEHLSRLLMSMERNRDIDGEILMQQALEQLAADSELSEYNKGLKILEQILETMKRRGMTGSPPRIGGPSTTGDGSTIPIDEYKNIVSAFRAMLVTFGIMKDDLLTKGDELRLLREYRRKKELGNAYSQAVKDVTEAMAKSAVTSPPPASALGSGILGGQPPASIMSPLGSFNEMQMLKSGSDPSITSNVKPPGGGARVAAGTPPPLSPLPAITTVLTPSSSSAQLIPLQPQLPQLQLPPMPPLTAEHISRMYEPGAFNPFAFVDLDTLTKREISTLIRKFRGRVAELEAENDLTVKELERFAFFKVELEDNLTTNNIAVRFEEVTLVAPDMRSKSMFANSVMGGNNNKARQGMMRRTGSFSSTNNILLMNNGGGAGPYAALQQSVAALGGGSPPQGQLQRSSSNVSTRSTRTLPRSSGKGAREDGLLTTDNESDTEGAGGDDDNNSNDSNGTASPRDPFDVPANVWGKKGKGVSKGRSKSGDEGPSRRKSMAAEGISVFKNRTAGETKQDRIRNLTRKSIAGIQALKAKTLAVVAANTLRRPVAPTNAPLGVGGIGRTASNAIRQQQLEKKKASQRNLFAKRPGGIKSNFEEYGRRLEEARMLQEDPYAMASIKAGDPEGVKFVKTVTMSPMVASSLGISPIPLIATSAGTSPSAAAGNPLGSPSTSSLTPGMLHRGSIASSATSELMGGSLSPSPTTIIPAQSQLPPPLFELERYHNGVIEFVNSVAGECNKVMAKVMAVQPNLRLTLEELSASVRDKIRTLDAVKRHKETSSAFTNRAPGSGPLSAFEARLQEQLRVAKAEIDKLKSTHPDADLRRKVAAGRQKLFINQQRAARALAHKTQTIMALSFYFKWRQQVMERRMKSKEVSIRATVKREIFENKATFLGQLNGELEERKEEVKNLRLALRSEGKVREALDENNRTLKGKLDAFTKHNNNLVSSTSFALATNQSIAGSMPTHRQSGSRRSDGLNANTSDIYGDISGGFGKKRSADQVNNNDSSNHVDLPIGSSHPSRSTTPSSPSALGGAPIAPASVTSGKQASLKAAASVGNFSSGKGGKGVNKRSASPATGNTTANNAKKGIPAVPSTPTAAKQPKPTTTTTDGASTSAESHHGRQRSLSSESSGAAGTTRDWLSQVDSDGAPLHSNNTSAQELGPRATKSTKGHQTDHSNSDDAEKMSVMVSHDSEHHTTIVPVPRMVRMASIAVGTSPDDLMFDSASPSRRRSQANSNATSPADKQSSSDSPTSSQGPTAVKGLMVTAPMSRTNPLEDEPELYVVPPMRVNEQMKPMDPLERTNAPETFNEALGDSPLALSTSPNVFPLAPSGSNKKKKSVKMAVEPDEDQEDGSEETFAIGKLQDVDADAANLPTPKGRASIIVSTIERKDMPTIMVPPSPRLSMVSASMSAGAMYGGSSSVHPADMLPNSIAGIGHEPGYGGLGATIDGEDESTDPLGSFNTSLNNPQNDIANGQQQQQQQQQAASRGGTKDIIVHAISSNAARTGNNSPRPNITPKLAISADNDGDVDGPATARAGAALPPIYLGSKRNSNASQAQDIEGGGGPIANILVTARHVITSSGRDIGVPTPRNIQSDVLATELRRRGFEVSDPKAKPGKLPPIAGTEPDHLLPAIALRKRVQSAPANPAADRSVAVRSPVLNRGPLVPKANPSTLPFFARAEQTIVVGTEVGTLTSLPASPTAVLQPVFDRGPLPMAKQLLPDQIKTSLLPNTADESGVQVVSVRDTRPAVKVVIEAPNTIASQTMISFRSVPSSQLPLQKQLASASRSGVNSSANKEPTPRSGSISTDDFKPPASRSSLMSTPVVPPQGAPPISRTGYFTEQSAEESTINVEEDDVSPAEDEQPLAYRQLSVATGGKTKSIQQGGLGGGRTGPSSATGGSSKHAGGELGTNQPSAPRSIPAAPRQHKPKLKQPQKVTGHRSVGDPVETPFATAQTKSADKTSTETRSSPVARQHSTSVVPQTIVAERPTATSPPRGVSGQAATVADSLRAVYLTNASQAASSVPPVLGMPAPYNSNGTTPRSYSISAVGIRRPSEYLLAPPTPATNNPAVGGRPLNAVVAANLPQATNKAMLDITHSVKRLQEATGVYVPINIQLLQQIASQTGYTGGDDSPPMATSGLDPTLPREGAIPQTAEQRGAFQILAEIQRALHVAAVTATREAVAANSVTARQQRHLAQQQAQQRANEWRYKLDEGYVRSLDQGRSGFPQQPIYPNAFFAFTVNRPTKLQLAMTAHQLLPQHQRGSQMYGAEQFYATGEALEAQQQAYLMSASPQQEQQQPAVTSFLPYTGGSPRHAESTKRRYYVSPIRGRKLSLAIASGSNHPAANPYLFSAPLPHRQYPLTTSPYQSASRSPYSNRRSPRKAHYKGLPMDMQLTHHQSQQDGHAKNLSWPTSSAGTTSAVAAAVAASTGVLAPTKPSYSQGSPSGNNISSAGRAFERYHYSPSELVVNKVGAPAKGANDQQKTQISVVPLPPPQPASEAEPPAPRQFPAAKRMPPKSIGAKGITGGKPGGGPSTAGMLPFTVFKELVAQHGGAPPPPKK